MRSSRVEPGTLLLLLGFLVVATVLATAGVATVVPEMAKELSLSPSGSAWVLSLYSLGFAFAAAVFGQLSDRWGAGRTLCCGVGLFAVGALVAGAAWTVPVLLLGRLLEGFGGGSVAVLAPTLLTAGTEDARRRRSLGRFTAVLTASSAAGPLIGGLAGHAMGWRVLMMAPALSALTLPALSWAGAGAYQRERSGPTSALAMLVAVPLSLVHNRAFMAVCAVGAALFGTYFSLLFTVPVRLGAGWDWSPLEVGLGMLPAGFLGVAGSWLAGRVRNGPPTRTTVRCVCLSSCLATVIVVVVEAPLSLVFALGVASGALGVGYVLTLNALAQTVPEANRGTALGMYSLYFYLAGAAVSALAGALLDLTSTCWAFLAISGVSLCGVAAARWGSRR